MTIRRKPDFYRPFCYSKHLLIIIFWNKIEKSLDIILNFYTDFWPCLIIPRYFNPLFKTALFRKKVFYFMCFSVTIVDETKTSGICKDQCECYKLLKKIAVSENICKDQCECYKRLKTMTLSPGNSGTTHYEKR